jgi:hypothetical protein
MTDYLDPETIARGAGAVKSAFAAMREMLSVFKDAKDLLPEERKAAAAVAIESSEKQLAIAEAQIAQALGYHLCKCSFPPVIMLTVGTIEDAKTRTNKPVYECPSCGTNTAYPFGFSRTPSIRVRER